MRKAPKRGALHPLDEDINRIIAKVRARVEHPFRVLKCQFGYLKTRYRGLAKNRVQLFTLFALGNLFLVRRLFGQADLPKSPAYPVDLSKSDRPRPDIGEAEAVDQTVPKIRLWEKLGLYAQDP
jgi:hypothetical protein